MRSRLGLLLPLLIAVVLCACGGGGGGLKVTSGSSEPPPVGDPRPLDPEVTLSLSVSDSYTFGAVSLGNATSVGKSFVLTNTSSVNGFGLSGLVSGDGFNLQSSGCGSAIQAAATCSFTVGFLPNRTGAFNGLLVVQISKGKPITLPLVGTGVSAPLGHLLLEMSPDPGQFPQRLNGDLLTRAFYLKNDGNAPLTNLVVSAPIDSVTNTPSAVFTAEPASAGLLGDLVTPHCVDMGTLPTGARCGFVIKFTPTAPVGALTPIQTTASMAINYNDSAAHRVAWGVTGRSVAAPVLSLTAASANALFVNLVPTIDTKSACLTLTNPHAATAAMGVLPPSTLAVPFSIDTAVTCPNVRCSALTGQALGPLASCDIGIKYAPTTAGPHSISVAANFFNGAVTQTAQAMVTGTTFQKCTFPPGFGITIAAATLAPVDFSGSKIYSLPADAKTIVATVTKVSVDDYAPLVKLNNVVVYNNSAEPFQYSREIVTNFALPLVAGANTLFASCKNRRADDAASITIFFSGSYYTAGACTY